MSLRHSITVRLPNSWDFKYMFCQNLSESEIKTFCLNFTQFCVMYEIQTLLFYLDFSQLMCLKTEHMKAQISDKFGFQTFGCKTLTLLPFKVVIDPCHSCVYSLNANLIYYLNPKLSGPQTLIKCPSGA